MGQINKLNELLSDLESEKLKTWFDLGLYLDKIRDQRPLSLENKNLGLNDFINEYQKSVAFITFNYGVDGVSIELLKYAGVLQDLFKRKTGKNGSFHFFGGSRDSKNFRG